MSTTKPPNRQRVKWACLGAASETAAKGAVPPAKSSYVSITNNIAQGAVELLARESNRHRSGAYPSKWISKHADAVPEDVHTAESLFVDAGSRLPGAFTMNVDYPELVRVTRELFADFPELQEKLGELIDCEDPPLVYTAMTVLARTLIDQKKASNVDRFAPLFNIVEESLRAGQFDVRNLVISGLLEDLWNLSDQVGIASAEWEAQLGEVSQVGWRAVLDYWGGQITSQQYTSILKPPIVD